MSLSSSTTANNYASLLLLFQQEKYREVINFVTSESISLAQDPACSQIVAGAHFQLGEFQHSFNILKQHEAALGTDASYLSLFGATCRRLGYLVRARDLLSRSVELDPASLPFSNNYANLLIDLGEFNSAKSILERLLALNPEYSDAKINLQRLTVRQVRSSEPTPVNTDQPKDWIPADPLMLAFAEDEVREAGAINFKKPASQAALDISSKLPSPDSVGIASDQLKLASQANLEGNPIFALQLISNASESTGAHLAIYMNAADSYVRLQRFDEAEICFLHALQMGGNSFAAFLNLATISCLRSNYPLARYYLDSASDIDPSNSQLIRLKEQLSNQSTEGKSSFVFQPSWELQSLSPLSDSQNINDSGG